MKERMSRQFCTVSDSIFFHCLEPESNLFLKRPSLASFLFILSFQTQQFLQQIYVKNVHPVYGARIWTHDPQNTSLLP